LSDPSQPSPEPPSPMGNVFIAILLISAFIIFIGIIIVYNASKDSLGIEVIEKVGAIWGPWVGVILGYYFGSRNVDSLTENNKNLSKEAGKKDQKLTQTKELMLRHRNNTAEDVLKLANYRSMLMTRTGFAPADLENFDEIVSDLKNEKDLLDATIGSM
jgi:hypothetical protein